MSRQSLRKKLLLWVLLPMACLIAIDSTILYRIANHFKQEAFDRALYGNAYDISELINDMQESEIHYQLRPEVKKAILSDKDDTMYYSVIDDNGHVVGGDEDFKLILNEVGAKNLPYYAYSEIRKNIVRVVVINAVINNAVGKKHVIIQVAETLNKRNILADQILIGIVGPQLLLLFATAGLVWFGIGRGLRPLAELQTALSSRSHRDLSPVQLQGVPEEVNVLVDSINLLMSQLKNLLESQNRFVADAAHQLRTPLAGMQAQIELAQNDPNPNELKECLERIGGSADRLIRLVNQLLLLARNQPEVTRSIHFSEFDLNLLAQEVTTDMVPAAYQKNIDLGFESTQENVLIQGEPMRLKEMLYNLIDNAILYTQQGGKITVSVGVDANEATLCVEDNGRGIPVEDRDKVFERFHRVVGNQEEGSGLGLAIVMEIAQIHRATITVSVPESGTGTRFCVTFKSKNIT